jgi:two-component system nitrate/nitrite response regulator NarL
VNIVVLSPVRLLADALAVCLRCCPDITVLDAVSDLEKLRATLATANVDLVLIDVTQGIDLFDVRWVADERPGIALLALGLTEQPQEVIQCGRAGYTGYVTRDATVDTLCRAMCDVMRGRLACPAEISSELLRALFLSRRGPASATALSEPLTRREGDVLQLVGRGLANKEIARELRLSVATVKHHVHNIFTKLEISRRTQAMQKLRDFPWITSAATTDRKAIQE